MKVDVTDGEDVQMIWDRLNEAFLQIYKEISQQTQTVRWQALAADNFRHHLMAYAEFERVGRDNDEDLVLNVSIVKRDEVVVWETDVCQTRGRSLADGPRRVVAATQPLASWLGDAADDAIAWFQAETPNFIAYLNQELTPYDVD